MKNFISNNYPLLALIISITGAVIVPLVIYYLQNKNKHKDFPKPDVRIYDNWDRHFFNIEILNSGDQDIFNFQAKIFWQKERKEKQRDLDSFIDEHEDQLIIRPRNYKILRKGEKIIAVNIPRYSDTGEIKIVVKGVVGKENKEFYKESIIHNKIKSVVEKV